MDFGEWMNTIFFVICFLFGVFDIGAAIEHIKADRPYRAGLMIILAFCMMVMIAKVYFTI